MSAVTAGSEQLWEMENELRYPRRVPGSAHGAAWGAGWEWTGVHTGTLSPRAEGPQDGSKGDGSVWVRFSCPRHCGAGLPGGALGSGLIPRDHSQGLLPRSHPERDNSPPHPPAAAARSSSAPGWDFFAVKCEKDPETRQFPRERGALHGILVCVPTIHCCSSEQFIQKEIGKRRSSINGTDREWEETENSASCQVSEWAEHQLTQSSPGRGAALGVNGTIFHFLGKKIRLLVKMFLW